MSCCADPVMFNFAISLNCVNMFQSAHVLWQLSHMSAIAESEPQPSVRAEKGEEPDQCECMQF